jgi:hypothetical protein
MADEPICIYGTGTLYLAELLKQMLADNGITAFIMNKQDSAYKFGDIEIYVNPDDVIRAKKLIREFEES